MCVLARIMNYKLFWPKLESSAHTMLVKFFRNRPVKLTVQCYLSVPVVNSYGTFISTCQHFAEKELLPVASRLDKENMFPAEQIRKLGLIGAMGILVSEEYGGAGRNTVELISAVEEISRCCAGTGAIVNIHNALFADVIDKYGTPDQKKEFLPTFVNGENVGSFALSEPGSGSDAANLKTTATSTTNGWILNGTKAWVTNGHEAKAVIVFASTDRNKGYRGITAFIVDIPTEGLSLGRKEEKLGIRASSTCNIILEDVRVSKNNILGVENGGFKLAMSALNCARIGIASQATGIGQAALDCAIEYASKRTAFGKSILKLQAVQHRIARMETQLQAAKALTYAAAHARDQKVSHVKEASIAKVFASEAATSISHNCIQILGGLGYVSDMPAERHYRDARITEIYGGPTDIQLLLIADQVAGERGYRIR